MSEELFQCPRCEKDRPRREFHEQPGEGREAFSWICAQCRSDTYFKAHYPVPCCSCLRHRRTSKRDRECDDCLAGIGLRECRTCLETLPLALSFSDLGSFRCRVCRD